MSDDILTVHQVAAVAEFAPPALIESHEALRRDARMAWEAAYALARQLEVEIPILDWVATRRERAYRHEMPTIPCALEFDEVA